VNNVAVTSSAEVVDVEDSDLDRLIDVNLKSVVLMTKHAAPRIAAAGGGSITNIGSISALRATGRQTAYTASKGGVVALTSLWAVELGRSRIRVNCICPGRTLTPLVEQHISWSDDPEAARRALSEDRPMKRMGKPEEIAAGILFLASDEAPYATGAVLSIDGGYVAQ
jgi:NAD(P)-dependent dehydrogenase (short-subunit alcohol dehydrogenase family)